MLQSIYCILRLQMKYWEVRIVRESLFEDPFSFLLQETLKSLFPPHYDSLKLNHDTNYLMTYEATVEDPLVSVQFYIKSKVFSFRVTVHLMFSFFLQETFRSLFQQPYDSLKPNHDKNYLMNSEDTFEDPLRSVNFNLKSNFFVSCFHPSTAF